ncbi:ATP-dependent DNA helicase Q-like 3 [Trametes pubescens]|uniref:ATP-dependent DNA helicase Q-like 3 n=1 Tax=Trametes pubescens TaxID=154538 RepID=A0A1M2W6T0_TRAPU|nr:ATP-dependent DNA helicase Q-like 3 [Trametes pubescens]
MASTPDAPAVARSKYHDRSHTLLDAARADARKKRKYDSGVTRNNITLECIKRTQLEPYPEQLDLAECMLLGVDAVSIAGTGWGKTLPFVLPLFVPETKDRMIIIISPLNALEEDQAKRFRKMGLLATALNGESNNADTITEIERGKYRVVILGPKLFAGGEGRVRALFSQPRFTRKVLGLVVDEAHCISQWGGDFRPEYADIGCMRALLAVNTAVHATSATMPPPVLKQVSETLLINLNNAFVLHLGNDRPNITWEVVFMTAGKTDLDSLGRLILARLRASGDVGALRCLPKTMVFFDDILQSMRARRWLLTQLPESVHDRVKEYNSRRGALAKRLVMRDFERGDVDMLFATEAAGMPSVFQEMGKKTRKEGEPVVYKKEIDPGLRKWVVVPEDECRRDVADEYFDNPPRRIRTSNRFYQMDGDLIETTVADLRDLKWRLADRHGAEVLALLEPIDRKMGLEKLYEEKEKYESAEAAKEAKAEEKRLRDEQRDLEKREREFERELQTARKQAEATRKKQEAERKKQEAEQKKKEAEQKKQEAVQKKRERERAAARKRYLAGARAATRAVPWIAKSQDAGVVVRPNKRKRNADKEDVEELEAEMEGSSKKTASSTSTSATTSQSPEFHRLAITSIYTIAELSCERYAHALDSKLSAIPIYSPTTTVHASGTFTLISSFLSRSTLLSVRFVIPAYADLTAFDLRLFSLARGPLERCWSQLLALQHPEASAESPCKHQLWICTR